ncbi:Nucleoside-diphosphate-sugar epimerase [Neorhodopirellula lusitana]|uniref:Nucleoside-diphosphate-sugar epimerase n=1 Tax=Neorhodopirellula lusitana TaxID=445327 RepID=A0ABY1QCT1_9BACT|nr:Nucleoside-diphosphate-sugar epimerase [Neorhodopirellula lusitana]
MPNLSPGTASPAAARSAIEGTAAASLIAAQPDPRRDSNSPPMPDSPSLLVVGCGYLGQRVAQQAIALGWNVAATTRNPDAKARGGPFAELCQAGVTPIRFDWNDSRDLKGLLEAIQLHRIDRVLVAVSHDRHSPYDRYASQVDGFARLLQVIRQAGQQRGTVAPDVAYISTTGVYHQTGGLWVDENSTTHPTREGGKAHLLAEAKLRVHLPDSPWTILRLSGIYGPGRVPRAADVRAGRPIASPPTGHLNLIHVDDAAAAVITALSWPTQYTSQVTDLAAEPSGTKVRNGTRQSSDRTTVPRSLASSGLATSVTAKSGKDFETIPERMAADRGPTRTRESLYIVSDDEPVIRREFYQQIARQTRSPEPTFVDPATDSGVRFRSETDKRIWNRRCKRDLLPRLMYPTYREGLAQILNDAT